MRIEINFKGHPIEKPAKLKLCQYVSLLKLPNFDAMNIKWFTVPVSFFSLILYVQPTIFQLKRDESTWVELVLS